MSRFQRIRSAWVFPAAFLILGLAGCGERDVQVYKVAKESPAGNPQGGLAMPTNENPPQPQLKWILPAGWLEVAPGEMRVASFKVKGQNGKEADVSVIQLSGNAGGDLNNVNRWRGQVGLPPIAEETLSTIGEKMDLGASGAVMFDLAGTAAGNKTRILATVLHRGDAAWFFKMTGDDELVAGQKPPFVAFLKSLTFAAPPDSPMGLPANHPQLGQASPALPPDHPPIGQATPALPSDHPPMGVPMRLVETAMDSSPKPLWQVPASWTEEPATQMLLAKFSAGDKSARAEITVSSFPGEVGGLPANVNRWRRQMGLPANDEAQITKEVKPLDVQTDKGALVELQGMDAKSGQPASLIGVAVPHGDQTWFFKMAGDAKVVAREKEAFIKFVQNVKLPNAP